MEADSYVFVVCSDVQARAAIDARLKVLRLRRNLCKSADEFFEIVQSHSAGCALLWIDNPRVDLRLLERIEAPQRHLPVVGISACADLATAVCAMKLGAFDFLDANCTDAQLRDALQAAFSRHSDLRQELIDVDNIRRRLAQLSPAHRQVLDGLVTGLSNRDMANELKLSVRGVEERRAKVMQTMQATSLADLVRQVIIAERSVGVR